MANPHDSPSICCQRLMDVVGQISANHNQADDVILIAIRRKKG